MIPKIFLFEVDKNFKDAMAPLKVKEKLKKGPCFFHRNNCNKKDSNQNIFTDRTEQI